MQDKYAGDIGDFGKIGLLRVLQKNGLKVGVNWYKVANEEDKKDGKYAIDNKYNICDIELAKALSSIYNGKRTIKAIEDKELIKNAKYYNAELKSNNRHSWHKEALKEMADRDIVFLDPDNGLVAKRATINMLPKYVIEEEIFDYLDDGKSVVFYNHRSRKQSNEYFKEIENRLNKKIITITFPKCTVRDYIFLASNNEHKKIIKKSIDDMINSDWGKLGVCRIEY